MQTPNPIPARCVSRPAGLRRVVLLGATLAATTAFLLTAGCGTSTVTANSANATFSLAPAAATIDTNCSGCKSTGAHGLPVYRFAALLARGGAAAVEWSLSGGDPRAGPGTISTSGEYTPPSYLTTDRSPVLVTARLASDVRVAASAEIVITPGFLQPLTPENVAVAAGGSVTLTGRLAVAGGGTGIRFALATTPTGTSGGAGLLGAVKCTHSSKSYTACAVTYTAPPAVTSTEVTFVVARVDGSPARTEAAILLNTAGVNSNPVGHQGPLPTLMPLGSSGGNNSDFDARGNTIADCCSGTLGALVQDNAGRQFILSNNHVLARSDHASVGDAIVQPGLIDNNCTPSGEGPGTVPVGSLTAWLPLKSSQTNVDAALAQVASRTVDAAGSILELGARQPDGTLGAAPPGISSSGGKGEAAEIGQRVAKSGRTTGLTCGTVSAVAVDVSVDYFRDCAETRPYLTKTFSNQVALSGDRFSDAGDSGSLVVDSANAEPVGLFFAGGTDAAGVGQGIASPAGDVLSELSSQAGSGTALTFAGGPDHAVSCLSYGDNTVASAQALSLRDSEIQRAQQALAAARLLLNPRSGILGVSMGKSSDHPGEAAVIVYVDEDISATVPNEINGVRTVAISTSARAVAMGTAPLANSTSPAQALPASALTQAIATKQRLSRNLLRQNPAFFGVGAGQSLDNPREAALILYVDRRQQLASLPEMLGGLRTRYIVMDRLHVTRSYATPSASSPHCLPRAVSRSAEFDPQNLDRSRPLF